MSDIEKLKEIFLDEVDEETKADNLAQIQEWETALLQSEEYQSWKDHDVTRRIAKQARDAYVEISLQLATNRNLTEAGRELLYGRQDAMLWILSLTERDTSQIMTQIHADIQRALQAVS